MSYVIAGAGGFLGMDKHDVAIPVRQYAAEHRISHGNAAMAIGVQSVWRAKQTRGLFP